MISSLFTPLRIFFLLGITGATVGGIVTSQMIVTKVAQEEALKVYQKQSQHGDGSTPSLTEVEDNLTLTDITEFLENTTLPEQKVQTVLRYSDTFSLLNISPQTANTSGLRFFQLNKNSPVASQNGKVLSVDENGQVILVDDKDSATTNNNTYTTETTEITQVTGGANLDELYPATIGQTFFFDGSNWDTSTLLYNNGSRIGINTTSPLAQLQVDSSSASLPALLLKGANSQSVPLQLWQDSTGLTVASVSASGKLTLGNRDDDHSVEMYPLLEIFPDGDAGELSSSGGALYIDNSRNYGSGINIFSSASSLADGHLLNIKADDATFDKGAIYVDYDGTSNAVNINHNGATTAGNALSVTGNNPQDSTVGVIGYETGRGTVKITHNGTGTDANASGLSIDVKGEGTRAQGIYVDSTATSGTLGNLLRLRNQGIDRFVVSYLGGVTMGSTGTNTTFTKLGNNANDEFFVGTNGAFRVQRSASDSETFRVQVAGDTQGRWLGTSDGKLKWGDGSATQDVILRRSAALNLLLDGSKFQIKSPALSSDLLVFTNAGNTRIGRMLETAAGHGWFEISDNAAVSKVVLRADNGLSYFNGGNVSIGTTGTAAKLQVVSTSEQLRLTYNDTHSSQFLVSSAGLLTVTPTGNMNIASNLGVGGGTFGTGATNVFAITNSTAPSTAITNGIQLFAVDQAGSHELRVMDEAANITTLSPHNFSLIPEGKSEDLAWSFYSERNDTAINADMTRALRALEDLSGEQFVFMKNLTTDSYLQTTFSAEGSLKERVQRLEQLVQANDQSPLGIEAFVTNEDLQKTITWTETVATFIKQVVFKAKVVFESTTEFASNVIFKDSITVSANTAGTVEIPAGATKVKVTFAKEMPAVPQVYLTFMNTVDSNPRYKLEEVSKTSFIISLAEAQADNLSIQWLVLLKEEGQLTTEILERGTIPISSPAIEEIVASDSASQ